MKAFGLPWRTKADRMEVAARPETQRTYACCRVVADFCVTGATKTSSGFSTWFPGKQTTAQLDALLFDHAQFE